MNGIYVENWKIHGKLTRELRAVFDTFQITFDYGLWCPRTWVELKKETTCIDAKFHITMESEALQAWQTNPEFRKALEAVAEARDHWWEQGFHWSIHLYRK